MDGSNAMLQARVLKAQADAEEIRERIRVKKRQLADTTSNNLTI